jgi:hypothetical protein
MPPRLEAGIEWKALLPCGRQPRDTPIDRRPGNRGQLRRTVENVPREIHDGSTSMLAQSWHVGGCAWPRRAIHKN